MGLLRALPRALGVVLLVAPSVLAALLLAATRKFAPKLDRRLQPRVMRIWFRTLARLFGLVIEVEGRALPGPAMLACNHRSWLDIVALGATLTGSFVSKAEISRWALVGYLASRGGRTLFINRGELRSFRNVGGDLLGRLRRGERVLFFPEGTVSAAKGLLRFKPRLFEAAEVLSCPVQPVALSYEGEGGARAPMMDGDLFAIHALRMLCFRSTIARIRFLAPLAVGAGDAKGLAEAAHARVAAALGRSGAPAADEPGVAAL